MGQKAEWSCGFDKSQSKQFVWSMLEFSLELLLPGSILSASDEFQRFSSSPFEPSSHKLCVYVCVCACCMCLYMCITLLNCYILYLHVNECRHRMSTPCHCISLSMCWFLPVVSLCVHVFLFDIK